MPDTFYSQRPNIAIIGAGISGMGAAYYLRHFANVTLFDAEARLGGHARTVLAGKCGDQPVDTGFIVFNTPNYPHLCRLFKELEVPVVKSDMSFGASINGGDLEYGLRSLGSLFAQRRNLLRPSFWKMLRDVQRFNAYAYDAALESTETLNTLITRLGLGEWFTKYYITPLSGAIWSTPTEKILDFPAQSLLRFFKNHALLSHTGQHQWHTVEGGSTQYVQRLERALRDAGVVIRLGTPIKAIKRESLGVRISDGKTDWQEFDQVVMAIHTDQALQLLDDPTVQEQKALGQFKYQPNDIILHADTSVMPKRRACWASWVYTEEKGRREGPIDLSYWMNSLQPIPQDDPMFVTLNSQREIKQELIYDRVTLHHPVYDFAALETQGQIRTMNGSNSTWYCGAWMKNGFHEDGLSSAYDVAQQMMQSYTMAEAAE